MGRNYKHLKFPAQYRLTGLSNQQSAGCILIPIYLYTCQLIYDPCKLPCSQTGQRDTLSVVKCQNV